MSAPQSLLEEALSLRRLELELALTHSSWVGERGNSNERLEFLGDSVLGLAVASYLYEQFPDEEEGDLAKLKAFVVSRRSCAEVARRIGLEDFVHTYAPADDAQKKEIIRSDTALGNMLEAVIGAVYLGRGFDVARDAVEEAFRPQVTYAVRHHIDYKTTLQEHLAERNLVPTYRLVGEEGPPHDRVFTCEVLVRDEPKGRGSGTSIKQSEQRAARQALQVLGLLEDLPEG